MLERLSEVDVPEAVVAEVRGETNTNATYIANPALESSTLVFFAGARVVDG
jgi:hypothetical protein